MKSYDYLIVGGGMTGDAAVRGIRSEDEEGSIAIVSSEPDPPYDRPPLSKGLWRDTEEDAIWRHSEDADCEVLTGRRIVALDRDASTVTDEEGRRLSYGQLLLATGGEPRTLRDAPEGVNYFRTYRDFRDLRSAVEERQRFAVVGGGFLGSELAAALAMHDRDVVVLFPEEGLCRRILPPSLSGHLNEYYRGRGVDLRPGTLVDQVDGERGEGFRLSLKDGGAVEADYVVAGLGIRPRLALAREAGLDVGDGIVTDETFRTSDPNVWAAGDVALFPSPILGRSLRVEHEDHANSSGTRAGRGMAGSPEPYDYVPLFYSDLFDVGYEAVGVLDPALETVEDWTEPLEDGVVYYLEDGRVRGVLLWNHWGKMKEARWLLREQGPFRAEDLEGRL